MHAFIALVLIAATFHSQVYNQGAFYRRWKPRSRQGY